MNHHTKSLSMSMFEKLARGTGKEGNYILDDKDFQDIDFKEFLVYNFGMYSPSYLNRLMLSSKKIWDRFSLNDWIEVIKKAANDKLAVRYCLSFLYKYIGIDSLKLLAGISGIDDVIKRETLSYFENYKGNLAVFDRIHLLELEKFNFKPGDFFSVRDKLLKEGAKSVAKIYPDKIDLA